MATPNPNLGQALLSALETDLLTSFAQPLINFLTAFGAAGGDPVKVALAWVGLQGALVAALPNFEVAVSQQISNTLIAKLQAALNSAKPA